MLEITIEGSLHKSLDGLGLTSRDKVLAGTEGNIFLVTSGTLQNTTRAADSWVVTADSRDNLEQTRLR